MSDAATVTFYLHPKLRRQAERGAHNFIRKVGEVLKEAGLSLAYDDADDAARLRAMARPGHGLFLMQEPVNNRSLCFRKTYIYPFWRIEKQAKRWEWPVALATFDASTVDPRKAANFCRFWRNRLFDDAVEQVREDGFVYVPLQERLTKHRSFQFCSPIEMIKTILDKDPDRYVMVTLHPSGFYDLEEQNALEELLDQHERLYVRTGGMNRYLRNCDYIVTQNSTVGFLGYFYEKPVVLFGQSDYHHIALNVHQLGVDTAFAAVPSHQPNYTAYLNWFLQQRSINAGRPEANAKIRTVLKGHGWPV